MSSMSPRADLLTAPISPTEIVIMGGYQSGEYLGGVFIFDTNSESVQKELTTALKFSSIYNPCAMAYNGLVVGLVIDETKTLKLVSYTRGQNKFEVVEELGKF